ncbi:glycosyltransferase [Pedobacter sp. P351]|uniref:glycosyltransferase n=1 Tax=Pedobacter superstes TaxID=3133441 RepID=UPI0030A7CDCF
MKKRILFITPSLSKGGAETQLIKIARFLKSKNHEVMIISLKPINEFNIDFQKEDIDLVVLQNWTGHFFSNWIFLYKTVKSFRCDVVIAFMFIAIIFARLLKIFLRFKLISTIRISVINRKWYIPFKITSTFDDGIVYNSHASKLSFERSKLVSKPGIVIYNRIEIPLLKPLRREHSGTFNWVCIAHFRWNKDYLTLFKAIALIKEKNFRVDILGNLNKEVWPLKIIEELKIQDRVRLLGFQPKATDYLESADAFVLSSFSEGMPNAILEAMARNIPVVVTDIDGNNELVNGAQCGFLSKPANEVDLAHKMSKLMSMGNKERIVMAENGRKFIETNFSEKKIMGDWLHAIELFSGKKAELSSK